MSPLNLLDAEAAGYAEFDGAAVTEANGATITQLEAAAFPGRGSVGYRVIKPTVGVDRSAYGTKTVSVTTAAGESFTMRCRIMVHSYEISAGGFVTTFLSANNVASGSPDQFGLLIWSGAGDIIVWRGYDDSVSGSNTGGFAPTIDQWHEIEVKSTRATGAATNDGTWQLWVDGVAKTAVTGKDNFHQMQYGVDTIYVGSSVASSTKGKVNYDIDNIEVFGNVVNRGKYANPGVGCIHASPELAGFGRVGVIAR